MRRLRPSLVFTVGRDLLFAVLACAAALLVSLSIQLDMTKRELRQASLDNAAQRIAAHLEVLADGNARLAASADAKSAGAGYPALVFDHDGRLLYGQPARLDPALVAALSEQRLLPADQLHRLGAVRFFTLALGARRIVGIALHTGSGADARVIEVFKDENAPDVLIDDVVREFPYRSAEVLLPLFALLLIAGWWLLQRRMWPIGKVSAIAETIGPQTLNLRLPEGDLPAELLPIVRGVNGAFARLEQAGEAQRDFLRRAAHQLRTPMTVLLARVDSLDDAETAEKLRGDVHSLSRIISQLLQLNEIEALPDDSAALADLGAVAEAVRDELAPLASRRDQRIALALPPATVLVHGDPNVIEIAVRNLAENALQHSPDRSRIELSVTMDAGLGVADRGPGVADALREKIFEPFWSDDPHGARAGLGLTIVDRIAERYGAIRSVAAAPNGGALFTLRFRRASIDERDLDAAALRGSIPASLARHRRREALDHAAN